MLVEPAGEPRGPFFEMAAIWSKIWNALIIPSVITIYVVGFTTVEVTSVIPANSEYFDLYREQLPDLAPLVDYLETSQPFAYPTQSKKFADRLISLMQEALMNEESTLTGQEIVTQLAEEFGNK